MADPTTRTIHLDCVCGSLEHVLRLDLDLEEKELWASFYLSLWLPWHKRLWLAAKYVLGVEPAHGHFDTWCLKPQDAARLRELLDQFDQLHTP